MMNIIRHPRKDFLKLALVAYYGGYDNRKAVYTSHLPAHIGYCSPLQSANGKNSSVPLINVGSL